MQFHYQAMFDLNNVQAVGSIALLNETALVILHVMDFLTLGYQIIDI